MMQLTSPNIAGRAASVLMTLTCAIWIMLAPMPAHAVVFVEGNCGRPQTATVPGACGDYDGDGRLGSAEDTDGDHVFGTITAALGGEDRDITIVTSGVFFESLRIIDPASSITLQAAPGVAAVLARASASIDGDVGITIRGTSSSAGYVVLRNLHFSRREVGILVEGSARVAIESCRVEHSDLYGISVGGNSRATITGVEVHFTTGFLSDDEVSVTFGIRFSGQSSGAIFSTTVSGNGFGISNRTGVSNAVCAYNVNVFDNFQNFENVTPSSVPCGSRTVKGRTFFDR